jgi:hypothetical protein
MTEEKKEVKQEEKVEKSEPTITQDDLMKAVSALEELVKARDEEEEEEKEEEEEEKEEKSFAGNFEENETLEKAVEVSDFLAALVDETETSIDALGREMVRMQKSMGKYDTKFIESLGSVATMLKAVGDKLDAFDARLKVMEHTPAAQPKTIMKSAQPIEKSFNTGGEPDGLDTLTRRQKIEIMEKAVADGKLKDTELFNYEANHLAPMSDETKTVLKSYLSK